MAKGSSAWASLPIDRELVAALQEIYPVGDGQEPIAVLGWPAPGRLWLKIEADYPNGWKFKINFNRKGEVSSARASFRLVSEIRGKSGTVVIDEAMA